MIILCNFNYLSAQELDYETDSLSNLLNIQPNTLSFGLDKQLNIYAFNFLMNYRFESSIGNFSLSQKYLGTAYSTETTIIQDDEDFGLTYDYPVNENLSLLGSGNYILINNLGSDELNALSRKNFLVGARVKQFKELTFKIQVGIEDNNQMGILSQGNIFKIYSILEALDLGGYRFDGILKGEILSLNLDRINRTINFSSSVNKQYAETDMIFANLSYKVLDRYNAFRRDSLYIANNGLDFDFSLESRFNNMLVSDVTLTFGLAESLAGMLRLTFTQNNIERFFNEYIPNDPRTGVKQFRNQLRVSINPELVYNTEHFNQVISFFYSFESDENTIRNVNSISEQEFNLMRGRAFELDNLTSIFRLISKTKLNISRHDTLYLSGMSMVKRFDTPSPVNNSDRDEFLGLISLGYGRAISDILTFRFDTEAQFNHQVNLRASRSASNFWMRSLKFAPSLIIQTKNFFMRPQPYVLANYTVYDFEGFAPGLRSFSLRQIGYNDSITFIFGQNLYLGTRIDVIYKETGTLFWNDFKEQPVNGNLKLFFKYYAGYFDERFNVAIGIRYFNLTQQTFRKSAYINSDYKTESFAPEVIINANFFNGATLQLNGWYEYQIINDTFKNEIPNIILNTSIKL